MKVAIIGAGIVGATAAYYLSSHPEIDLTVFDHGKGQATKAAAGIISPWFSKRRNKSWYQLARLGADFYPDLIRELKEKGHQTDFYQRCGVYLLRKEEEKLKELYHLAMSRKKESPLIGDLKLLSQEQVQGQFPGLQGFDKLLYASGGARVQGESLVKTLLRASQARLIREKVQLTVLKSSYQIAGQDFDRVILASGAWLPEILEPLGYQVGVFPQKGQLRDYQLSVDCSSYPVVMPEGEIDLIPFLQGNFTIGATHEKDQGYDLTVDESLLKSMEEKAKTYYPALASARRLKGRVGIRAYTQDFSPFWGEIPHEKGLYVASGLGSSGLTTGPILGFQLAQLVLGNPLLLDPFDYPVERYLKKY